jgi:uncharacterized protein (TIGR02147 family)
MTIFDFSNYKEFVQSTLAKRPKRGHGQYRKLAFSLRLSSVAVSQIIRGPRDFSPEQALEAAQFLLLNEEETEYFLLLVQRSRAGSKKLLKHLDRKISLAQQERKDLSKRVKQDSVLSEQAKAVFYSDWQYSAVRIASSIPALQSIEALADRFGLAPEDVAKTLRFLLENGLCKEENGGFAMGPSSTMLAADSPFINSHRRNWRIKGLDHLRKLGASDLFYSGLVSLSKKDLQEFRQEFVDLIARFVEKVKDSPSETLACLNMDWFELRR